MSLEEQEEKLRIQKSLTLNKALTSNSVDDIYKAQRYLKTIEKNQEMETKSILVDPMQISSSFGYKNKPFSLSYEVLRAMSCVPIIKSIIKTRQEQVKRFCEPQRDDYSTGFVIGKKRSHRRNAKPATLTRADEAKIDELYEFMLNCGNGQHKWNADTLDVWCGKTIEDALTLDQATSEVVRDRSGMPQAFIATDGGTYRLADSYDNINNVEKGELINGYAPSYVQVIDGKVESQFYPWEMMFGIRNPSSNIMTNGYGKSELEDMIQVVTAILNADAYNSNFFKVGSAPKGIIKYSGNINQNTVDAFRKDWVSQVSGVMNMHKIPIINADKMDFINLQQSNKDMEFSRYQEFLIKIACSMFTIDPSEIGFPMSGSADAKPMFEGNNEARLKYSKDKGLKPLLKNLQFWINKWFIAPQAPDLEFWFVGIDNEGLDEQTDLERDIQKLGSFMTLNEIRKKRNLKPVDDGDVVLNPVYLQAKGMAQQQAMMDQQQQPQEEENPFMKSIQNEIEMGLLA